MNVIYKYSLRPAEEGKWLIDLPEGSRILHIGTDPSETMCIWAVVDPEQRKCTHAFRIYATGETLQSDPDSYQSTVIQGPFVWHVFNEEA